MQKNDDVHQLKTNRISTIMKNLDERYSKMAENNKVFSAFPMELLNQNFKTGDEVQLRNTHESIYPTSSIQSKS